MNPASLKKYIDEKCQKNVARPNGAKLERYTNDSPLKSCDPLLPVPLVRRFQTDVSGDSTAFKKDDYYSIDVQQGVMGTRLLEGSILGREFGNRGQFAVLANVFEFADANATEAETSARRFIEFGSSATATGTNPGLKLIYYSGDVQRRQPFNFSNIPLRTRGKYSGNSVAIQLVVIEIDNVSGPVRELLSTLADFGQGALPGPPVAKDILFGLGKSLLSGSNHDDRLLEYRFVLSPEAQATNGVEAIFSPGQYVIRRGQTRNAEIAWGNVQLDHNTGRLFDTDGNAIRDDLYFTLNIKRYPNTAGTETYAAQEWSTFRASLSEAADERDKALKDVLPQVQKLVIARRTEQWRDRVMQGWLAAKAKGDRLAATIPPAPAAGATKPQSPDPATCEYHSMTDLQRNEQIAERDARRAILAFLTEYQSAAKQSYSVGAGTEPEFSEADRSAVIDSVARWFLPWPDTASSDTFKDVAAFESAYGPGGNSEALWTLAQSVASSRSVPPVDCAEVVRQGFGYTIK